VERLLERETELEMLDGVIEQAVDGHGALVLVGGEAGAGKTSLTRAVRQRLARRAAFLTGSCEPLSVPVPLAPIRELFDAAGGFPKDVGSADDRLLIARRLLHALADRAPIAAVIEDAHWADPMTLDVVRLLGRRLEDHGVVVIVTYRDDEAAANAELALLLGDLATDRAVRRIHLSPLSDRAIRELATPAGLDPVVLRRVTGGNPFLVVEAIAAGGGIPASVRDAALARVGRLSPSARTAVEAAAVVGQAFTADLVHAVAPDTEGGVDEALARGVLIAEDTLLGFRHELMRNAIEQSIPPVRRARLHGAVADALEARPGAAEPARLAHHAELAGQTSRACRHAVVAANEAERVGALRETHLQAERALRLGAGLTPQDRFEVLIQYVRAANFSSAALADVAEAGEAAVALARSLEDPRREGRALTTLAWALWSADRLDEAKTAAEAAAAVLDPTGDPALLARAASTLVRMEASAFDPVRALALAGPALERAMAAGLDDVALEVQISVALARGHRGAPEAIAILREACEKAQAAGYTIQMVRAYVNRMVVATLLRDHAVADDVFRSAGAAFEQIHAPIPALAIQSFHARSQLDRGELAAAWDLALRSEASWHAEVPGARCVRALVAARQGRPGAQSLIDDAWRELEPVAEGSRHAMARVAQVELLWLADDHAAAERTLGVGLASGITQRFVRPAGDLAIWARRYGIDAPCPENAGGAMACELAGDWRGAVRAWKERDAPYEAALAALPGDARAARDAVASLKRLGADAAASAFMRARAARGQAVIRGPRRSTLSNAAGLTRREHEVLVALSTGATNGEIAAALHLSERTVAHHVSAILGKLSAPNRVAAIERARQLDLLPEDRPRTTAT
jgi:DNA-binding CsgD family transcriptional regulator